LPVLYSISEGESEGGFESDRWLSLDSKSPKNGHIRANQAIPAKYYGLAPLFQGIMIMRRYLANNAIKEKRGN